MCYATNPESKIYSKRKAAQLCSTTQIRPPDANAKVTIISADGLGANLENGQPIAGNHSKATIPPSENDFSIGLLIEYGNLKYAVNFFFVFCCFLILERLWEI